MPGNRQKFAMRNTSMTHLTGWQKKWEGQNFGISKKRQHVWLLKSDMLSSSLAYIGFIDKIAW